MPQASGVGGHYWRIGDDIYDGWQSLMRMWDTLQSIPNIAQRTKPGAYTFLDQMLIGDVPGRTGAKNAFFEPFSYKNDRVTKTGSEQT